MEMPRLTPLSPSPRRALSPIEITFFNGNWTNDGTGDKLNHSGNPDPSVHGGANFHLRVSGADITTNLVAILYAPPLGAPAEPIGISSVKADATNLTLTWTGGKAPFQVQRRDQVASRAWVNVGAPTNDRAAAVPLSGAAGFFRVSGQ